MPVSLAQAQDNRTGTDRDSSVVQPQPLEPQKRPGVDAPATAGPPERLSLDQAVDRLERDKLALAAMWLEVLQTRTDVTFRQNVRDDTFRLFQSGETDTRSYLMPPNGIQ